MKKQKGKIGKIIILATAVLALMAAGCIYYCLLNTEQKLLEDYKKEKVYVCAMYVPRGELITEKNSTAYFAEAEIDYRLMDDSFIRDLSDLYGLNVVSDIDRGAIVTKSMFEDAKEVGDVDKAVLCSIKADDLYMLSGGVLRAGDRVNIYSVGEEETSLIRRSAFVENSFSSNGSRIEAGDDCEAAYMINIILDEAEVPALYSGISTGSVRVVKLNE